MLDHAWIAAHIPHQGRMCLLDRVLSWDEQQVCCVAQGHQAADHPLRAEGRLGIAVGIEYAAQAMAVHLRSLGREIGVLALLDAYPSEVWRAEPEPDAIAGEHCKLLVRIGS